MKLKQQFLEGLAMLLFNIPLRSEVTTKIIDNTIKVSTDRSGVEGYKGCNSNQLIKMSAFVFELQVKKPSNNGVCSAPISSKWLTYIKKASTDNFVSFGQIPKGKYRVIVYAGSAMGCEIKEVPDGFPTQSIIYEKEASALIDLSSQSFQTKTVGDLRNAQTGDLKVFPNPAKDIITIELNNQDMEGEVRIILINLLGQTMKSEVYSIDKNMKEDTWMLDVSNYPPGAYFIKITDLSGKSLQKKVLIVNQ